MLHFRSDNPGSLILLGIAIILIITQYAYVYTMPLDGTSWVVHNEERQSLNFWDEGIYFSAVTLTTLGYGDIAPMGSFRYLAILEAFTGFVFLVTLVSILAKSSRQGLRRR